MTIEELDEALDYPTIKGLEKLANGCGLFERVRRFSIGDAEYKIEWWKNVSYLNMPCGAMVVFEFVKRTNTWPWHSKMNLQFQNGLGNTVCVIRIEGWKE